MFRYERTRVSFSLIGLGAAVAVIFLGLALASAIYTAILAATAAIVTVLIVCGSIIGGGITLVILSLLWRLHASLAKRMERLPSPILGESRREVAPGDVQIKAITEGNRTSEPGYLVRYRSPCIQRKRPR